MMRSDWGDATPRQPTGVSGADRVAPRGPRASVAGWRRVVALALVTVAGTVVTACTAHHEALTHPCPTVTGRGVIALAKVGLSADELKAQEKC